MISFASLAHPAYSTVLALCCLWASKAAATPLPPDFVLLSEVAPDIVQDIRYASKNNFTGAPLPGYRHGRCWLTRPAAEALARVQAHLHPFGLGLMVYDCYRPKRAVRRLMAWAHSQGRAGSAAPYLGRGIDPEHIFLGGYLSHRSAHGRGSTVDVAIIARSDTQPARHPPPPSTVVPCDRRAQAPAGALLDFGVPFDCLSPHAAGRDPSQPHHVRAHRMLLWSVMRQAGFVGYPKEWWHFRLKAEPYPHQDFDVPLPPPYPRR